MAVSYFSLSSFSFFFLYSFFFFINSTPFTILLFASTDPSAFPSSSSVSDFQRISFPSHVSVENDHLYAFVEELNFMGGQISKAVDRCLRSCKSLTPIRMQTTKNVLRSFTDIVKDWEEILRENEEVQDLLEDSSSSSGVILDESSLSYSQSAYLSVKKVLDRSTNVQNQLANLESVEFPSIDELDDLQIGFRDLGLSMDRLRFVVVVEKEGGGEEEERQTEKVEKDEEERQTEKVEEDEEERQSEKVEEDEEEKQTEKVEEDEEEKQAAKVEEDEEVVHKVDISAEGLELSQFVWEGMSTWIRSSDFVSEGDVSKKKEAEIIAEKFCEIVDTGRFSEIDNNSKERALTSVVRGVSSIMEDVVISGEELLRSLMYLQKDDEDDDGVLTDVELRNVLKSAETFLENVFLLRDYIESSLHDERTNSWRQRHSRSDDDDVIEQMEKKQKDKNTLVASAALKSNWKEQMHMKKGVEALNGIVESIREIDRKLEKANKSDEQQQLKRNGVFDIFSIILVLEELEKNTQNLGVQLKAFALETPWIFDKCDKFIIDDNVEKEEDENEEEEMLLGGGKAMMMKESVDRLNRIANVFSDFELTEKERNSKNIKRNDFPSSSVTTIVKGIRPPPSLHDWTSQFDLTRELQHVIVQQPKKQTNLSFADKLTDNKFLSLRKV